MSRVDVLRANAEFYRAFSASDLDAMNVLWARRAAVTCIHPGGPVLVTRAAIMESWRGILAGGPVEVKCLDAQAFLHGDAALVTCFEQIEEHLLLASNLFVREDRAWKMAHHHAAATAAHPTPEPTSKSIH